jgi:hypothetical protein
MSIVVPVLAIAPLTLATGARRIVAEKEVDVRFVGNADKPKPPEPKLACRGAAAPGG